MYSETAACEPAQASQAGEPGRTAAGVVSQFQVFIPQVRQLCRGRGASLTRPPSYPVNPQGGNKGVPRTRTLQYALVLVWPLR
jgi:hypothetical protein